MISKVKLALWLGFFLRLGNAFSNGFYGPSYGASDDSFGFHLNAVQYSQNLVFDVFVLGNIYSYILGIFYFITTDSPVFGKRFICFRVACIRIYSPTDY